MNYSIRRSVFSRLMALLLVVASLGAFPSSVSLRAAPTPATATDAVMFRAGMIDAENEFFKIVEGIIPRPAVFSFRLMANMNRSMADLLRAHPTAVFYFLGRAEAFDQIADLIGEPRQGG